MLRGIRTGRSSDASTQIGMSMEAGRWRLEAFIILTHAVKIFSVIRPFLMQPFTPNNYTAFTFLIFGMLMSQTSAPVLNIQTVK